MSYEIYFLKYTFCIEKYCEFDWYEGYVGKDKSYAKLLKKSSVFKQMTFEI